MASPPPEPTRPTASPGRRRLRWLLPFGVGTAGALAAAGEVAGADDRNLLVVGLWSGAALCGYAVALGQYRRERRQEHEAERHQHEAAERARAERERLRELELEARLEAAGRGVARADWRGWYFTGRTRALGDLVRWLHDPNLSDAPHAADAAGVARVVTGEPGSGKSAVLGRLVTLSDPARRAQALRAGAEPGTDPGERSLDAAIHAGAKPTEQVLELIAEAAGVQLRAEGLTSRVEELQAALRTRDRTGARPLVVVIDALDEALAPDQLARLVLRPLATGAPSSGIRLLLGTRPHLIPLLGVDPDKAVVDLDRAPYVDPGGLERYVRRLLLADGDPTARTPYQDQPPAVADEVAHAVATKAGATFLIAQLVAHPLAGAGTVVDVRAPGWQDRFPTTVGAAMDGYLARFGSDQTRVRDLLLPLAWAHSAGLADQRVWAQLASALGTTRYTEHDVRWLLSRDSAAVDLLQRTEQREGSPAWRLYHEALREHMRTLVDRADRDVQGQFTRILRDNVPHRSTGGGGDDRRNWLRADTYTRTHLATHAAAAGRLDHLLTDPGFLLVADPGRLLRALRAATSPTAIQTAQVYRAAAHRLRSRTPAERAAHLGLHAHQTGATEVAERLRTVELDPGQPWSVRWARWPSTSAAQTLTGHTEWVSAVAVGALHGRPIVVTGSGDESVRVWDLTDGAQLGAPLVGHSGPVTSVAVGDLGGRPIVVSGGEDGTVRVWDLAARAQVGAPLTGHKGRINAVAVGVLDGRPIVVSGGGDRTVRVWDLAARAQVGTPLAGHTDWVLAVAVGVLDGRPTAVTGGMDASVRVWDLGEGAQVGGPLAGHSGPVTAVAVGVVDGRPIAVTGSHDLTVRVWDLSDGSQVGGPLTGHSGPVIAVAVGVVDGRPTAVTGSQDRTVRVWDLAARAQVGGPLTGHSGPVIAVAVGVVDGSPVAVTGSSDDSMRVWDLGKAALVGELRADHVGPVRAVAVGVLDGRPVVVGGSGEQAVRVWDLTDGAQVGAPLVGHSARVTSVAVGALADGRPIAVSGGDDLTLLVWDLATGGQVGAPLTGHTGRINAVAVGVLDGRPIAVSGGEDGTVRVWDLTAATRVGAPLTGHTGQINAVAVGVLDGRPIAVTGGSDGTVRIWDLGKAALVGELQADPAGGVWSVAVGAMDGRPIAVTGSGDGNLRVWDLTARALVGELLAGRSGAWRVAVGALGDGRPIALSGGLDGSVRVWDLTDDSVVVVEVESPVRAVALTPPRSLVAGTDMGLLAIDLLERARRR